MIFEDFSDTVELVQKSHDARIAAKENRLRRQLALTIRQAMVDKGISIRELARGMNSSKSQVQRLLHEEVGGSLTLKTLLRAADCLGYSTSIIFQSEQFGVSYIHHSSWQKVTGEGFEQDKSKLKRSGNFYKNGLDYGFKKHG